ncbi:unnamed protein product [Notodromas monacha]|uniref:Uncharacterized protein n=1 Tax=Notodromas monacha TaxID=399045 RepID=A0A7R9G8V3_9CRUS|nr:unnamed protein product [Notodromas monacha]CAG0913655.1 unnamed protein product [Notodromas monacha]
MADGGFDVNGPDSEGISGGFRINVVPKGAWQSPPGVVFGTPGQVYADNRFPYLDHLKSVVDLQKEAFLTEMCVEEKSAKEPFAMGLDEETYFMIVELPCWLMVMFAALAIVTMIQRWQAGKPLMPFGASCEGYASVDVDAAGLGEGGLDGGQAGSVPYSRGEVFQPGRQAGPTGASGGPPGTSGAAPSSALEEPVPKATLMMSEMNSTPLRARSRGDKEDEDAFLASFSAH